MGQIEHPEAKSRIRRSDVECLPHMTHVPGGRPAGLPDTVKTIRGESCFWRNDPLAVTVRIHLSDSGALEDVELVEGNTALYEEVEAIVRRPRFDPALRHGVPRAEVLVQSFTFVRGSKGAG